MLKRASEGTNRHGVTVRQEPKLTTDGQRQRKPERNGKLSLYGLTLEDALRAAAKTGRAPLLESQKPNRQRKKRAKPA